MQISLKQLDIVWLFLMNASFVKQVLAVYTTCTSVPWALQNHLPLRNRVWWFINVLLEDVSVFALAPMPVQVSYRAVAAGPSQDLVHPGRLVSHDSPCKS